EGQGVSSESIQGTIQNDILKEYIARGTYIYPPRESMRIITDIFAYCRRHVPRWNSISVSGYHIREAGSTAVQEIAFTLADGIAYVDAARRAGLDVDSFASRVAFFFNVHNDFLEEVAKFRCARRLWARIMRERFKAKNPASWMLRFHAQTGGSTLTAQQPMNNVVRVAIQALSAALGGAQSIHTNSSDEALALPTEEAATVALRTQQIIAHETGVTNTVDPLGGAYAVEALTDKLEIEAKKLMDRVEKLGGAVSAIEKGFPQREIQESAYRYQKEIESNEREIVGVNAHRSESETPTNILRIDPETERDQIARLQRFKAERDAAKARKLLGDVRDAARGKDNLMPPILSAVKGRATLGEIAGVLREEFGTFRDQIAL
ncbi:MAG: acyl-CoA mutase large subunit family protein, partial [Vicinamibacteria bacterium]